MIAPCGGDAACDAVRGRQQSHGPIAKQSNRANESCRTQKGD